MIGNHVKLVSVNKTQDFVLWIMRSVEEAIEKVIGWVKRLWELINRAIINLLPKTEYYIDYSTGVIKRRKRTNVMGVYKFIEGKVVKIDDTVTSTFDDYTFMGWDESKTGYDEDLGYVKSKNDYRAKMKAKGFIPRESMKFSKKSMETRMKENIDKRGHEAEYKAFNHALKVAESRYGVNIS